MNPFLLFYYSELVLEPDMGSTMSAGVYSLQWLHCPDGIWSEKSPGVRPKFGINNSPRPLQPIPASLNGCINWTKNLTSNKYLRKLKLNYNVMYLQTVMQRL